MYLEMVQKAHGGGATCPTVAPSEENGKRFAFIDPASDKAPSKLETCCLAIYGKQTETAKVFEDPQSLLLQNPIQLQFNSR